MTDNELLLAISNMLDVKLEPIKADVKNTKMLLENDVLPRLQNMNLVILLHTADMQAELKK